MNLKALLIIAPSFLFVGYLMELVYHRGLNKGRRVGLKKGREQGYRYGEKDGILKVKHMLDGDLDD